MRNRRESRAKSSILTLKKAPRRNAVRLLLDFDGMGLCGSQRGASLLRVEV